MLKSFRFAVLFAGVTFGFAAFAQPAPDEQPPPPGQGDQPPGQGDQSDQADPPTRVGRLSYVHGAVSFVPAGENDWVEAQLNRPLVTGDKLWTDTGSRAELEVGPAAIRMDAQTSFDFLNLDDNTAQVELTQGTLNLRVRRMYDGQTYEIDTPTLAFVANRVGEFRVDVQPDGQTTIVSVMHGGGDVYGEGGSRFHVDEGQSVTFSDPQLQNYRSADLPLPDEFDNFALQRDQRWDNAPSKRYVSEDLIGYQDLDDYGAWDDAPEYGHVWYPSHVAVDWSPYHTGHWAWVGAYGWTWVDDAPWGFAPFHYGRWAFVGNRWGWCPGEIAVRPVYAPALVAFVGGGVGIGIGVGGPIGWFPLGYRDPYFPSYRVSQRYFTNINVYNTRGINVTVVNNYYGGYRGGHVDYANIHYANREVRGALVAVPAAAFVGARPVAGAAVRVDAHTFGNGRVSGFAAVAPTRASLGAGGAARAVPAGRAFNRPIVAATRPPAPVASFASRQGELSKNPGQPLAERQLRSPVAGAGTAGRAVVNNNVKVVTQGGAPAHTAAPVIQKGATVGNPAVVNRGNLPAVQRGVNAPTNNGRPPVNGAAAGVGRPGTATTTQTQRLDSARFAHPATGANGTPVNNAAQTRATGVTRSTNESVQNRVTSPTNNGAPNRTAGGAQFTRPTGAENTNSRSVGTTNNNRVVGTPQTSHTATTTNNPSLHSTTSPNEFHRAQSSTESRTSSQGNTFRGNNNVTPQGHTQPEFHQVQSQHQVTTPQVQQHANNPPAAQSRGGNDRGNDKGNKKDDDKKGH
jgi:hypothetical protein